jgi:regulator of protease activity HflC (stomatin/prohibitin superfamily)
VAKEFHKMNGDPGKPPPELTPAPGAAGSNEPQPLPLLPRLMAALRGRGPSFPDRRLARRLVRLVAFLGILVLLFLVLRQGVGHVRETEVGVLVDNLTGDLAVKERAGYHLFIPYASQLYVVDKTIQRLDLSFVQGASTSAGRDIKLKTADGSNVSLDMVINFKLIPLQAAEVLRHSGQGMRFAETWMEPFARRICLLKFGLLTTEEMYDATKRNQQARAALDVLNAELGPHGIEVVSVIPGEFRFYREYDQVIQEKKLADQQVEEQQAQAREALEDQERQLVEARKKAEVRLASFQGESANRLIQAKAEANMVRRQADGKYATTLLSADATLYAFTKQAEGELAALLAQAEGMEHMRKAMTGGGGINLVAMEYAKHLGSIKFSATPIAREPSIHQFTVEPATAATLHAVPPPPVQPVVPNAPEGGVR